MSFGQFKIILDKFPYVKTLSLTGSGEPFLNKDIFNMIKYAKTKSINTVITTNGTLMDEMVCRKIVDSGLNWLCISLDGPDKSICERIREGLNFELVVDNIRRLIEARDKCNKRIPDLGISFLLLEENMDSLVDMISFLKSMGIYRLRVRSPFKKSIGELSKKNQTRNFINNTIKLREILSRASRTAKDAGIEFNYANVPDKTSVRRCEKPWLSPSISVDGHVMPCCLRELDATNINFGNIYEKPFMGIWNSMQYKELRRKLNSKKIPKSCLDCRERFNTIKI